MLLSFVESLFCSVIKISPLLSVVISHCKGFLGNELCLRRSLRVHIGYIITDSVV
jgi:hypothetical protein